MRKIKYYVVVLTIIYYLTLKSVDAAACASIPTSGNYTVTESNCYIAGAGEFNGLDYSGGSSNSTTNTAVLTVGNGASLTIPSGVSAKTILAVGSISLSGTGSIALGSNVEIRLGQPMWMVDADGDGYPSSFTASSSSAVSGSKRRSYLTHADSLDCNDADSNTAGQASLYVDSDNDGYGASGSSPVMGCVGVAGYASVLGDCGDSSASAHIGSTYCGVGPFTNYLSQSSFDYNCSGAQSNCGTSYSASVGSSDNVFKQCIGSGSTGCSATNYRHTVYSVSGSASCGATGYYISATASDATTCTANAGGCRLGGSTVYNSAYASGVQGCN